MKAVVAVLLGLIGGFLIYMEMAMITSSPGEQSGGGFVAVTFLGGTALCAYLMLKGAKSISKVMARGSLIGAALWLLMLVAGTIMSGRAASSAITNASSGAERAGAAVGGGLMAVLAGGVSVFMAIVCLISFAIFYFLGRELKEESSPGATRKCPQCAEAIKVEAIKCKHCGAMVGPVPLRT